MPPTRRSWSKPLAILACGAVLAGAAIGWPLGAFAAGPPELELVWRAPDGCPPATSVQAEFVRLLGGAARPVSSKRIDVEATVRRVAANRWTVQLETTVDGVRGRRSLEGDSCRSVAAAAALILALTIDPAAANRAAPSPSAPAPVRPTPGSATGSAAAGTSSAAGSPSGTSPAAPPSSASPSPPAAVPSPPPPAPAALPPPSPEVSPPEAEAPERPPAPSERNQPADATVTASLPSPPWLTRPFLRTFAGGTVALLPEPAAIAGLAVGLRRGGWELELSGLGSQLRRAQAPDRPSAGGDFRLWAVGGRGCGRVTDGRLITRLCAGGEVERLTGRSSRIETPSWGTATLAAAVVTGVLAIPLGSRLELTLELAGSARVYRPKFTLTNLGPVHAVPTLAAMGSLGLTVKL